ncbi:hypothetical protein C7974DRAFT_445753 [Boeremia exigua]|uniref:uncharacterized protein n=1 Tax=Boeremia exigua TaxID=749465 RepID=UPI001E8DB046|nr:uncharacterized protein C7974DRAFT_445753 [Boeremia exigua]KAH6611848.1 hypothetical protein C7974DRAFT_445753 [Boeremia exigua]
MYWNFMNPGLENKGRTVETLAAELFQQDEWEIYDGAANSAKYKKFARKNETNWTISAAGLMQRIFIECSRHGVNGHLDILQSTYKDILVQYNGKIDDRSTVHQLQPPEGKAAREFIEPIFDRRVWGVNLVEGSSKAMDTWEKMRVVDGAENLARNCPYLFRHPWPLAFISLCCRHYTMKNVLGNPGDCFNLTDSQEGQKALADWKDRARKQIMNTYLDECEWDRRSVNEVWRTFLEAQIILSRRMFVCG